MFHRIHGAHDGSGEGTGMFFVKTYHELSPAFIEPVLYLLAMGYDSGCCRRIEGVPYVEYIIAPRTPCKYRS